MKSRNIILIIIIIVIIFILIFGLAKKSNKLTIPGFIQQSKTVNAPSPDPTSAPVAAPKTFKFDRSTDLKVELEKVNPAVSDSDFE